MPRKTINVCGHCNEAKATGACVICDKDLCAKHQYYRTWRMYYKDRTIKSRVHDSRVDMEMTLGPFCQRCWDRHEWNMKHEGRFEPRLQAAAQNVGNVIAREMFRKEEDE